MKKVYLLLFSLICMFSFNKVGFAVVVQNTTGEDSGGTKIIRIQNVKSCKPHNLTTGNEDWSSFQSFAKYNLTGNTYTIECTDDGEIEIVCDPVNSGIALKQTIKCTKPASNNKEEDNESSNNASTSNSKPSDTKTGYCSIKEGNENVRIEVRYSGVMPYTDVYCLKGNSNAVLTCETPIEGTDAVNRVEESVSCNFIAGGGSFNEGSGVGREEVLNNQTNDKEPSSETLKYLCDVNKNPDVMRAFKLGGLALNILKIMIPILLIILGSIDFAHAVISNDDKQLSKSIAKLAQRVIAGVVIFIIPTLIKYIFDMVDTNAINRYEDCYHCLLDVSECPEIPKVGEK